MSLVCLGSRGNQPQLCQDSGAHEQETLCTRSAVYLPGRLRLLTSLTATRSMWLSQSSSRRDLSRKRFACSRSLRPRDTVTSTAAAGNHADAIASAVIATNHATQGPEATRACMCTLKPAATRAQQNTSSESRGVCPARSRDVSDPLASSRLLSPPFRTSSLMKRKSKAWRKYTVRRVTLCVSKSTRRDGAACSDKASCKQQVLF